MQRCTFVGVYMCVHMHESDDLAHADMLAMEHAQMVREMTSLADEVRNAEVKVRVYSSRSHRSSACPCRRSTVCKYASDHGATSVIVQVYRAVQGPHLNMYPCVPACFVRDAMVISWQRVTVEMNEREST